MCMWRVGQRLSGQDRANFFGTFRKGWGVRQYTLHGTGKDGAIGRAVRGGRFVCVCASALARPGRCGGVACVRRATAHAGQGSCRYTARVTALLVAVADSLRVVPAQSWSRAVRVRSRCVRLRKLPSPRHRVGGGGGAWLKLGCSARLTAVPYSCKAKSRVLPY